MPAQSAPAESGEMLFDFQGLTPGTYKVRASYDATFPLDATVEVLATLPPDPDPAGFTIGDDDLVPGASTFLRSICRASGDVLVFTAESVAASGVDSTQAVYHYTPAGRLEQALAIPPLAYPALPSGATNRSTVRTTLRDFISGGEVITNTGVLSDDTSELDSEAPTVDWSDYSGMVPVDLASRSYGPSSSIQNAHAVRFYDPLREQLVTATFTGSRRNSTAWRNIMSRAIENTSDFSDSPEGTVRLNVSTTQVTWLNEDGDVLKRFDLTAVNRDGEDALIAGNRIMVVDSGLRQVFSYNPDGTTSTTGPPPPELATIVVNGSTIVVLGQAGPFTAKAIVVNADLPYRPHLNIQAFSLDPAAVITIEPDDGFWTFRDIAYYRTEVVTDQEGNVDIERSRTFPEEGTERSKDFDIILQHPLLGRVLYKLTVTLEVKALLVDPIPEVPPQVDPERPGAEEPAPPVDETIPPVIELFSASPAMLRAGDTAIVSWVASNADTVSVTRDGTEVGAGLSGFVEFTPASAGDTVFEITAVNDDGSVTDTATVTATARPAVPGAARITSFKAGSRVLASGGSTDLTWATENAVSARLDSSDVAVSGSRTVRPTQTTAYTLTIANSEGRTTSQVLTVVVQPADRTTGTPPNASATLLPNPIASGDTAELVVSTDDATQLEIDDQTVAIPVDGVFTRVYRPFASSTHIIAVTGLLGTRVMTRSLIVDQVAETPEADISASSDTLTEGESVVLDYRSSGAVVWSINGISLPQSTGSLTRTPRETTTYRFLVVSEDGVTAQDSVTVAVTPIIS